MVDLTQELCMLSYEYSVNMYKYDKIHVLRPQRFNPKRIPGSPAECVVAHRKAREALARAGITLLNPEPERPKSLGKAAPCGAGANE